MAGFAELNIEQGASFSTVITVNEASGAAQSLVNYTVQSQLRKSYYSSTANNFTATITDAANGTITVTMTAANTANLTPGRMVYDLLITSPTNVKTRVVEGIATILPSVTR